MTEKTGINSLAKLTIALEHREFASIMTASEEIQSRLVVKAPLTEPDCALLAGALFARSAGLIHCREYCESLITAQRAIRAMCVLGPEPELIDMIYKVVRADLAELESIAEARASVEGRLRSESTDAQEQRVLKQSQAALTRCEPLQRAITIALMRDMIELVEEWARVDAKRLECSRNGGDPTAIKPAHSASAEGFATRSTTLFAVRGRGLISDTPFISVQVGARE